MNMKMGAVIGLVLGYPLSYFFQPGALRAKMSLGDYISHISDILGSQDLSGTAIGVWFVSIVALGALGLAIERNGQAQKND